MNPAASSNNAAAPCAPLDLAHVLLGLFAGVTVAPVPMAMRQRTDAHWVIGIHYAADDRAVHGDFWERHPGGDEVLCLLEGDVSVTLEADGGQQQLQLATGQALVVPRGTWHRLQVNTPGRLMFITPSVGSEHRRVDVDAAAEHIKEAPHA